MAYYKMVNDRLVRVYKSELSVPNPTADDYAAIDAYPKAIAQMPIIATHGTYRHIGFWLYEGKWIYQWEHVEAEEISATEQALEDIKTSIKNQSVTTISEMTFDEKDAILNNLLSIVKSLI